MSSSKIYPAVDTPESTLAPAESPIGASLTELSIQTNYLIDVALHLGDRLLPVRNTSPVLKDGGSKDASPAMSPSREAIEMMVGRVKYARALLETFTSELEI